MEAIGDAASGPGSIYLVGGATAVMIGWREGTIDVDLFMEPEPPGIFEALPRIKDELEINVELAAPHHFIPALKGWKERSPFIARHGLVDFFHYDALAQTLAKIERDHETDRLDVMEMLGRGLVRIEELERAFLEIEPLLVRFPAIDPDAFRQKVDEVLSRSRETTR